MPKKKVNWEDARKDYIIGIFDGEVRRHPAQSEIARKYGVSETMVSYMASKEGWLKQREEYEKKRSVAINVEFDNFVVQERGTFDGLMQSIINAQMQELHLAELARITKNAPIKMSERLVFTQILLNLQKIKESMTKKDQFDRSKVRPEDIEKAYRILYPEGVAEVIRENPGQNQCEEDSEEDLTEEETEIE